MAAISGVMASHLAMVRTHTCEGREGESEGGKERKGGVMEREREREREREGGRKGGGGDGERGGREEGRGE